MAALVDGSSREGCNGIDPSETMAPASVSKHVKRAKTMFAEAAAIVC